MNQDHPALVASRNSWRCVEGKDREGWLALMAPDVCIEDPIGMAPSNPAGTGVHGIDGVREFWDNFIARASIRIEAHESFAAGNECAHVLTVTTTFRNGAKLRVRGIFAYRLNDDGKLKSMRGYWTMEDAKIEEPS